MEFCPVCLLRKALADGVASGGSCFEDTVKSTLEQTLQRFEHYELVKGEDGKPVELGRGAMGVTYKAFDINLRCPVTLKVISEQYVGDEAARLRFLREARAAARLRHSNVASVLHLGTTGQNYFYAMEFVEGETLEKLIKRSGPLKVKLALEVVSQVAAGLAAIHKQKLVHRDIKPSNIMVSFEEGGGVTAKIIDLGLAKPTPDVQPTETAISIPGAFAGTPEFASPEQFAGVGVDIRSDLYSLGVTFWVMVTGQTPFRGPSAEVMYHHQHAPLPRERLKDVPQPVVVLLEVLLEKDPTRRFQTPAELLKMMPTIAGAIDARRKITRESLLKTPSAVSRVETRKPPAKLGPKKISVAKLPVTGSELFGREEDIAFLDDAWANNEVNIVAVVAWAGVGKSTLVNHWLRRMAGEQYRSAQLVFGWSFYRQGTSGGSSSADEFIDAALAWFGDPDARLGTAWEKGERLAKLVAHRRTLLVLDGLEPLQNPPGPQEGRLREASLQALLRELAAFNKGLCVITTRTQIADIADYERSSAPRRSLEHLSSDAGAKLLRALGVQEDEAELRSASDEFSGHCLALTLLGSYLTDAYGGDIRRREEVSARLAHDVRQGAHARKVMESYQIWFGEGPELAVLRMLGLFDRPADEKAIAALVKTPAIPGLTESLTDLSLTEWRTILAKLRRAKLLAQEDPHDPGQLDTHPLVREYFGEQLRNQQTDAWKECNKRLFHHYRALAPQLPDNVREMEPLFLAVICGCNAGLYREALHEVYIPRIQRGNASFAVKVLGARGALLAVLVHFFEHGRWGSLVRNGAEGQNLTAEDQLFVLAQAGLYLTATRGLAAPEARTCYEQAEPLCHSLDRPLLLYSALIGRWRYCSQADKLTTALRLAKRIYALAEQQNNPALMIGAYRALALTRFYLGNFEAARQYARRGVQLWRLGDVQSPVEEVHAPAVICLCVEALSAWHLGEISSSHASMAEAISLANELSDAHALAQALYLSLMLGYYERNCSEVERLASDLIELSTRQTFAFYLPVLEILRGWVRSVSGDALEGLASIEDGIRRIRMTDSTLTLTYWLAIKAEALHRVDRASEALQAISEAQALVERYEERAWAAELHRLRGVFLAALGADETQIEVSFSEAVRIAKEQKSISLAKRAEVSFVEYRMQKHGHLGHGLPPEQISVAKLPVTGSDLFGREEDIAFLDDAWNNRKVNVVTIVAWAGVGKSTLVNHWLRRLAAEQYRSAQLVFGWSFYRQGTSGGTSSADEFIDAALAWFGDPDPRLGTAWEKGERLAKLVAHRRTLLVLDGLEPLQNPPGSQEGRLRDPSLQALLRELAAFNMGLCVITTRTPVADIADHEHISAPRRNLEQLSSDAGAKLLRALGVKGDEPELLNASKQFSGHCLALTLLGSYLTDAYNGDIRRRKEVSVHLAHDVRQGVHARKVMESYQIWFGEGPELSVLRMLGLFDRPAEENALETLLKPPAIEGLTEPLIDLNPTAWRTIVARLRRARLLAEEDAHNRGSLDTHPLVREYFGDQLRSQQMDAWKECNRRLYNYYRALAPRLPDSVREMEPLFLAVICGCNAGLLRDALHEVYIPRIQRGDAHFAANVLGATGPLLLILGHFFEHGHWGSLVETAIEGQSLTEEDQLFILMQAGLYLTVTRGMGAPETRICWKHAESLCHSLNRPLVLFSALLGLWRYSLVTMSDNLSATMQIAKRIYALAQEQNDSSLMPGACGVFAATLYYSGDFESSRQYATRGVHIWRLESIQSRVEDIHSPAVSCLCYEAVSQWHFGEIASSQATIAEAISLAKELKDLHALGLALCFAALLGAFKRSPAEVERWASDLTEVCTRQNFGTWLPAGPIFRGWARSASGDTRESISWIEDGIEGWRANGAILQLPYWLTLKAEALHLANRTSEALEAITEADTLVARTEERWWCAELHRVRGVFLAAMGADHAQIEASFCEAIRIAKEQKSISLEKRAESTYAEYRRQKASASVGPGFRLPLW
jgi:tetratricopeptide (TPR) repeat protein